jgi:3-oxoacyl-[acyl-carrier protein] reductase
MADPPRVAVVTGAAQGLGRAVAAALARAGWRVIAADLNEDAGRELEKDLAGADGELAFHRADVTAEQDIAGLANAAGQRPGALTLWVNNAGVTRPAMLHKMSAEDFDLVLAVHARGTFLGIREAARRMIAAGAGGAILNVTSSAGLQGTLGQINYSAAKGAIVSMTKSAARELARYQITVNAVAPVAATPMTEKLRTDQTLRERFLSQIPLRRFGEPDEIAPAFLFLASDAARYITGQVLCVDGGLYMAS